MKLPRGPLAGRSIVANYATTFALCSIFLIAGALRIGATNLHREIVNGDETTYWYAAKSLLKFHTLTRDVNGSMYNGGQKVEPTATLSPGYPLFIASILAGGGDVYDIYVSNIALSLVSMLLMLWIMLQLGLGRIAILFSMALAAAYPGFIYNLDRMLTEQLYVALFLGFAATFIKSIQSKSIPWMIAAGCLLAAATQVRAEAVAFIALALIIITLNAQKERRARLAIAFVCAFALIMAPWWVRNLLVLHRPLLLTDAASGPARWGATPYYIDMPASDGTVGEVLARNVPPAPWVFLRWRLFGFLQYMWGDVWDERLVHPLRYLRQALLIQPIAVWLPLIFAPLLAFRRIRMGMFVALIPICYTLVLEPIQALPRYIFPAVPFTFVLLAALLTRNTKSADGRTESDVRWLRLTYFAVSAIFAIFLVYSLFVFPSRIAHDQSEYRLARYMGIHISQLPPPVWTKRIDLSRSPVANTVSVGGGWLWNNVDAPPIVNIDVPKLEGGEVVTKVHLAFRGGFYLDRAIIYWLDDAMTSFSENKVFTVPTNMWGDGVTIYIDGDVSRLMLVPFEFRWAKLSLSRAVVTKYLIAPKHPSDEANPAF